MANSGIDAHSGVIAEATLQHLQVGRHFPLVSDLDDLSILVGGDGGVPDVVPRLLGLQPFE